MSNNTSTAANLDIAFDRRPCKCFYLSNFWDVVRFDVYANEVRITGADKRGSAPERITMVSPEVARQTWQGLVAEGYKRDMSY